MKTVDEYLAKYPDKPSMTLAKLIYAENPDGINVNLIRDQIRYRRGSRGDKARIKRGFMPRPPVSETKPWIPYLMPEIYKNTLVIADLHIPDHDREGIELAINEAVKRDVDSVIIDGDLLDCYQLSSFNRDPSKARFKQEIETTNEFLDYLQEQLPKAKIIFKTGNHEERLNNYVKKNAAELFGIDEIGLAALLDALNRGMTVIGDSRVIKYGHLHILHGHEVGKAISSPVNPARGLYLRVKTTALGAHHHQSSTHHETDLNGVFTSVWTIGCLSTLSPEYLRVNKWCHGYCFLTRDKNDFHLENYKIIKGVAYNA